ncbi:MAG: RsmD family RNA methyltransferase, partial [Anaerolineales bacterium]|nr:RsmD family RNA methyltransferase [Anaerolineales bacterium]
FIYLSNKPRETFDIIYIAPPQYKELWSKALFTLDKRIGWLAEDGVVIVQIHPKEFKELDLENVSMVEQRKYGNTMLCFYQIEESQDK